MQNATKRKDEKLNVWKLEAKKVEGRRKLTD